jgi:hypothetical protein
MRAKLSLTVAAVLVSVLAATAPAEAACKRFGFTVNDYGKEGPTNDAKNLLDKHIAEWAAQNGVTAYQTGKKNVSCELFLDVILFDEHTCTASANVCWGDGVKPNNKGAEQAEATDAGNGEMPPAPVSKAEALGIPAQQQTAAAPATATDAAAVPAVDAAPTPPVEQVAAPAATSPASAPTTPVEQVAAPAATPPATPAVQTAAPAPQAPAATATAVVETGALQAGQGLAADKQAAPPAALPQQDRAAAAAAAASAAAAAERAAQAAETAANAAKEAAAAAVAASAASKAPASVPPLDHASGAKPTHSE